MRNNKSASYFDRFLHVFNKIEEFESVLKKRKSAKFKKSGKFLPKKGFFKKVVI